MRKNKNHWLDQRLADLPGKNLAGLARRIGVPSPRLSELKKGAWRIPLELAEDVAAYLEWDIATLSKKIGRQPEALEHPIKHKIVTIKGAVAAGEWRESAEWPPDEWLSVRVDIESEFDSYPIYGIKVVGESMNLRFPPDSILECVKYIDLGREPRNGEYVVVHRRNMSGLYECTVKKYTVDQSGRVWLMPESTRPEHQRPLPLTPNGEDDQIVVVARVIKAHISF